MKNIKLKHLKNVQILWSLNYYDGPLSGVLLCNNELCYFDLLKEQEPFLLDLSDEDSVAKHDWYRKFIVYNLSDDDKIRLATEHAIWQTCVGLHNDYYPLNTRKIQMQRARKKQKNFTVPVVHGVGTGFKNFNELKEKWEKMNGKFSIKNCKPIGWVYNEQLFAKQK